MRTTTPNWCAVLSGGVDQGKSLDAQYLGTCTSSNLSGEFLAQNLEVVTESERPIELYPKIRWEWTGWQYVAIVVNIKLTIGFSVVKVKGRRHRFRIAELLPPSLEISCKCSHVLA